MLDETGGLDDMERMRLREIRRIHPEDLMDGIIECRAPVPRHDPRLEKTRIAAYRDRGIDEGRIIG
jgi:hypothetical protein